MDLMKILRSLEEIIFEAATWLVFYPLTLWRIVRRPLTTMAYSDREQADPEDDRYDDALSPPLLLLFTVVIANVLSAASHISRPPSSSEFVRAVTASQQNFALFRALVFSLIPLVAAATLLRRKRIAVSRESLRAPFYAQCYLASPCAVFISVGGILMQRPDAPACVGPATMIVGALWFLVVQARWFREHLAVRWFDAGLTALWATVQAIIYLAVILFPIALI